jgi:hypothetical protein
MTEEELRKIARKRAKAKTGFYIHLIVYIIVNILLVSIWYFTSDSSELPWFIFPLIGWGIALVIHGLVTFRGNSLEDMEDRMTERELAKLKAERSE